MHSVINIPLLIFKVHYSVIISSRVPFDSRHRANNTRPYRRTPNKYSMKLQEP